MQSKPKLIETPVGDVVELPDLKSHLSITSELDDSLLQNYLSAAADHLDGPNGRLGRCLITQTWQFTLQCWSGWHVVLPFVDVETVIINYFDEANSEQTINGANFALIEGARNSEVVFFRNFDLPDVFDRPDAIKFTMSVGFGDAASVPSAIKQAVRLIAASWYEHREGLSEGVGPIPDGVDDLIADYRVRRI